jgi:hypothetical protein
MSPEKKQTSIFSSFKIHLKEILKFLQFLFFFNLLEELWFAINLGYELFLI